MAGNKDAGPESIIPANDNSNPNGDIAQTDIAPCEKVDRVVLSIARLIGRQMAREEFERMRAATANDNMPTSSGDDEGEADKE